VPFCPKCKYEYVEGIELCPDCDLKLVPELHPNYRNPEDRQEPADLVVIATFMSAPHADMAKLHLDSAGIDSALVGDTAYPITPIPMFSRISLMVRQEDAERARDVLSSKIQEWQNHISRPMAALHGTWRCISRYNRQGGVNMQPVYTVDQIAGHFGKSSRTIRKWITLGRLQAKKVGKGYLITEDALSALVRPESPPVENRKALAREFIEFMQSLDIPKGTMERIMNEDIVAEDSARREGHK
jgi:excisionase family DNA binding protein